MKTITQENKDLLLKDLCARLPYGVKVQTTFINKETKERKDIGTDILGIVEISLLIEGYEEHKPYLFPLSSMTEEQQKEYRKICDLDMKILENRPMKGEPFPAMYNSQDWLDAHHFDYRGLIEKELAIDATGLNIY